ncbi:MAG: hypothetical protein E7612_06275 [Ruminococcaceae bacterium]|nr:hypothetical protein [Oscillospiraceae bacterium]
MKKRISLITVISIFAIAVIINILLFSVLPETIQHYPAFWLIWSFTFPVNFAFAVGLAVYFGLKDGISFIRIPVCFYIVWIFSIIYFGVGLKLMFVPFGAERIGIPLSVELAITVAYFIVIVISLLGVSYIEANQKYVKKKVLYIRNLKTDVDFAASVVSDTEIKRSLEKLAEAIRFSDPMTHSSLADTDAELSLAVRSILADAKAGNCGEELKAKINKTFVTLEYRNEKCKILK